MLLGILKVGGWGGERGGIEEARQKKLMESGLQVPEF